MSNKTRKTRYHVIPPEYIKVPEGKEALAQRIAAQRQRLIGERQEHRQESLNHSGHSARQDPLLALAFAAVESVPVHAVELVKKRPVLSLLIGAGALVAVSLVIRRIGTKRLMRGVNVLSPFLIDYLGSRYLRGDDR